MTQADHGTAGTSGICGTIFFYTKKKDKIEAKIENSTWARVDMEFLFECSTRKLTNAQ